MSYYKFVDEKNIPKRMIFRYKPNGDYSEKWKVKGAKGDDPREIVESDFLSKSKYTIYGKNYENRNEYLEYEHSKLSEKELDTIQWRYETFIGHIDDFYCLDVDIEGINEMDDYIKIIEKDEKITDETLDFLESCTWAKGNSKGLHIFMRVRNCPQCVIGDNVLNFVKGDFKKQFIWEKCIRTDDGFHCKLYNNPDSNVEINFESIYYLFNDEKRKQVDKKKTKKFDLSKCLIDDDNISSIYSVSDSGVSNNSDSETKKYIEVCLKYNVFKLVAEKCNGSCHDKWLRLGFLTKNSCGLDSFSYFNEISKQMPPYIDEKKCKKDYDDIKESFKREKCKTVTLGTLKKFLQEADNELYKKINKEVKYLLKNDMKEIDGSDTYEHRKVEFEKKNCKIKYRTTYMINDNGKNMMRSEEEMIKTYRNMHESSTSDKEFVQKWIRDENLREYLDVGVFPNNNHCPKNVYNLWIPYKMEEIKEYTPNLTNLEIFRNHLKVLCDYEEEIFNILELYIAQLIQYPEVKPNIVLVFTGDEGAGKSKLIKILEGMLGKDKVFESAAPDVEVFTRFNGRLENTILLHFEELEPKHMVGNRSKFNTLVTNDNLEIEHKGFDPYPVISYHRIMVSSNNDVPIAPGRRVMYIKSSNELAPKTEANINFWTKYTLMEKDTDTLKTIYEFYKSMEGADKLNSIKIPESKYHKIIKETCKHPIELWIEDYARENKKYEQVLNNKEIFSLFNTWLSESKIKLELSSQSFSIKLGNIINSKYKDLIISNCSNSIRSKTFRLKEIRDLECLL